MRSADPLCSGSKQCTTLLHRSTIAQLSVLSIAVCCCGATVVKGCWVLEGCRAPHFLQVLLQAGASPSQLDRWQRTAAQEAKDNKHDAVAGLLSSAERDTANKESALQ